MTKLIWDKLFKGFYIFLLLSGTQNKLHQCKMTMWAKESGMCQAEMTT